MSLQSLFDIAIDRQASDLHFAPQAVPRIRVNHELVPLDLQPLTSEDLSNLLEPIMTSESRAGLDSGSATEKTILHGDFSFAGIIFGTAEEGPSATFRIFRKGVPSLAEIGAEANGFFEKLAEKRQGLILITGGVMSGKWTTACALVDWINERRADRIFVLQRNPSYRMETRMSMVSHIHVGADLGSYARALEVVQQADPDVVAMDDIPTLADLRQALILAETGHLVVANLHAESAIDAIVKLVESAGADAPALERSLAQNLLAVTCQRLIRKQDGTGRVPVYQWIWKTSDVAVALQEGDIAALAELQASDESCRTEEAALEQLVAHGVIQPNASPEV